MTIGVEFGSRIVAVGPPASNNNNDHPTSPINTPPEQTSTPQKHMKLSLWDTAGQETYKSVTRSYFRGASGALLVFDITRRETFTHVTDWLNDLRQIAEPEIVVVLVGNKTDLAPASMMVGSEDPGGGGGSGGDARADNRRQVTTDEAERWCRENGVLKYVETSAKSGHGVEAAFLEVAERIYQNIEAGKYDLNDRRSGVKGPGVGPAAVNSARTMSIQLSDAVGGRAGRRPRLGSGNGWTSAGGCC